MLRGGTEEKHPAESPTCSGLHENKKVNCDVLQCNPASPCQIQGGVTELEIRAEGGLPSGIWLVAGYRSSGRPLSSTHALTPSSLCARPGRLLHEVASVEKLPPEEAEANGLVGTGEGGSSLPCQLACWSPRKRHGAGEQDASLAGLRAPPAFSAVSHLQSSLRTCNVWKCRNQWCSSCIQHRIPLEGLLKYGSSF